MSTTHRSDGPLLAGYHHSGDRGLGLLAETFPSTGEHGPSLPFPGLVFPADTGKEIICRIVTVPPLLTLFEVDELGRVTAEGPDGVHTGQAEGFADGTSYNTYPFEVRIGARVLTGVVTADDAVPSGVLSPAPPAQLAGAVVADDAVASGGLGSNAPAVLTGGVQADDAVPSGQVVGYVEPIALIGTRVVTAGRRRTPLQLPGLYVTEQDDVVFRFGGALLPGEAVMSYVCTAEPRWGTDAAVAPLRVGPAQRFGTDCVQRINGALGIPGVTYLLQCVATLNSGRTVPAAAYQRVVQL